MGRLLAQFFWPSHPEWGPTETAQRRVLSALANTQWPIILSQLVLQLDFYLATPKRAFILLILTALIAMAPIVAGFSQNVKKYTEIIISVWFCCLSYLILSRGFGGIAVHTVFLFAISTTLLLGLRAALLGCGGMIAVLLMAFARNHSSPETATILLDPEFPFMVACIIATIVAFVVIYTHEMRRATRELEEARAEAEKARAEAESASRSKSDFLANMSHEIRTPMNGVLGTAELLQRTELDEVQSLYAHTILSSGAALLTVINDILDFSKIEANRLELAWDPVDLRAIVDDLEILLGVSAQEKGLALTAKVADDVPARVIGDAGRIRQILTNVVGNAVKFTPAGKVEIEVSAHPQDQDRTELIFTVHDTGIGIPADKLDTIFDGFTQVEASITRDFGGTGLGLSITRSLVEMMGGRIDVASTMGEGTTMSIRLPLGVVESSEVHPIKEEIATEGPPPRRSVLVVEDNEVNRMVVGHMIGPDDHDVVFAENGEIGLRLAKATAFDLILMDISMPVMDGSAATAALRAWEATHSRPPTPIVALTAHAMSGDAERYLGEGFDGYLSKPIKKNEIDALLRQAPQPAAFGEAPPAAHIAG